jgi:hypothetical protein
MIFHIIEAQPHERNRHSMAEISASELCKSDCGPRDCYVSGAEGSLGVLAGT